jgi:hypothetical protein
MALSYDAKQAIRAFQDDDFNDWFHNGHESYFGLAEELIERGYEEADAIDFLFAAYCVVENEFGE